MSMARQTPRICGRQCDKLTGRQQEPAAVDGINAEVERFNRVMKDGLRTGLADGHEFITAVRHTLAAYRTTPQGTTGVTPAALMLSFSVRTPLIILPLSSAVQPETSSSVTQRVRFQQLRMSEQHDQRHRAKLPTIQAGDMVRIGSTSSRRSILNRRQPARRSAIRSG